MYDNFMLIAGIIFVILTIFAASLCAVALMVTRKAEYERKFFHEAYEDTVAKRQLYMDAIERSNETVVEKFRHELDCHSGEITK